LRDILATIALKPLTYMGLRRNDDVHTRVSGWKAAIREV